LTRRLIAEASHLSRESRKVHEMLPPREDTVRLVQEYRALWTSAPHTPLEMMVWMYKQFELPIDHTANTMLIQVTKEQYRFARLMRFCNIHEFDDDELVALHKTEKLLQDYKKLMMHTFLVSAITSHRRVPSEFAEVYDAMHSL